MLSSVVECVLSKCKALGSIATLQKNKKMVTSDPQRRMVHFMRNKILKRNTERISSVIFLCLAVTQDPCLYLGSIHRSHTSSVCVDIHKAV